MHVKKMKTVLIALIAVIALVGVVLVAKGYPDWNYQILPLEGAVFEITGNVDANITNAQINVNITNTSLDVNVTNSTLNVTVQGTADVEIQNAELNVQTLREQASAAGNVEYGNGGVDFAGAGSDSVIIYTNHHTDTVYLEQITCAFNKFSSSQPNVDPSEVYIEILIADSDNNILYLFPANLNHFPINFDPAIPIPPEGYVKMSVDFYSSAVGSVGASALIRTP